MANLRILIASGIAVFGSLLGAQAQSSLGRGTEAPDGYSFLGPGLRLETWPAAVLLNSLAVQKELKITPEQLEKVRQGRLDLSKELARRNDELQVKIRQYRESRDALGLPREPETERALVREHGQAQSTLLERSTSAGLDALDRRQRSRLEQIRLQADGPLALARPDLQERLNIGPDQAELIESIVAEGRNEMRRVASLPLGLPTGYTDLEPAKRKAALSSDEVKSALEKSRNLAGTVHRDVEHRITKVLTKRQRESFQKMKGEPFDFAQIGPVTRAAAATSKPTQSRP